MASLLTPGAFGGADAGPPSILAPSQNAPSILAPSQKAQPPSILNQGPPSILAPAPEKAPQKSAQKKKKPQKAKQPDPERTTVPVGDAVALDFDWIAHFVLLTLRQLQMARQWTWQPRWRPGCLRRPARTADGSMSHPPSFRGPG